VKPFVSVFIRATLKGYNKVTYMGVRADSLQTNDDDTPGQPLSTVVNGIALFLADFYLNTGVMSADKLLPEFDSMIAQLGNIRAKIATDANVEEGK